MEENKKIVIGGLDALNSIINQVDVDIITSDETFSELPAGYYLCEVEKGYLTKTKQTNKDMAVLTLSVLKGYTPDIFADDEMSFAPIVGVKKRKVFNNYVLDSAEKYQKFVSDMLKFEGEEKGKPLLEREYFMVAETIQDALDILVGSRIYINISISKKDGKENRWTNLLNWKRVSQLNLPE